MDYMKKLFLGLAVVGGQLMFAQKVLVKLKPEKEQQATISKEKIGFIMIISEICCRFAGF
jgi:hypothetical protein